MTQQGKVICQNGDYVTVSVIRTSACEGCKQKKLCIGSSNAGCEAKTIEVKAKNSCSAKAGQTVVLQSDSKVILFLSFCIFIVPLILAFAGYFAALSYIAVKSAAYITAAVSFFVPALALGLYFDRKIKKQPYVEAVKILDEE